MRTIPNKETVKQDKEGMYPIRDGGIYIDGEDGFWTVVVMWGYGDMVQDQHLAEGVGFGEAWEAFTDAIHYELHGSY